MGGGKQLGHYQTLLLQRVKREICKCLWAERSVRPDLRALAGGVGGTHKSNIARTLWQPLIKVSLAACPTDKRKYVGCAHTDEVQDSTAILLYLPEWNQPVKQTRENLKGILLLSEKSHPVFFCGEGNRHSSALQIQREPNQKERKNKKSGAFSGYRKGSEMLLKRSDAFLDRDFFFGSRSWSLSSFFSREKDEGMQGRMRQSRCFFPLLFHSPVFWFTQLELGSMQYASQANEHDNKKKEEKKKNEKRGVRQRRNPIWKCFYIVMDFPKTAFTVACLSKWSPSDFHVHP